VIPESYSETGKGLELIESRDGRFSMNNCKPGHYLLFALDEFRPEIWQNATFFNWIRPRAVEVDLQENQSKSVDLKSVSDGEIVEAVSRARIFDLFLM
jgi:hypothetical protein